MNDEKLALLWSLPLGSVVFDQHTAFVWQKRGKDIWQRTGSAGTFDHRDIAGPVLVLLRGSAS